MVFHLQAGVEFQQQQAFHMDSDMQLHAHLEVFDPIEFECNQDRLVLPHALIAGFTD
jgi:hypothetical protein